MTKRRSKNGFTLIELLLVMGVITLLMALLFPTIALITNRAKATQTRQVMQTLTNMFGVYQQSGIGLNQSPTAVGLPANYWGNATTTTSPQETAPTGSLLPGTTNRQNSTMSLHTIIVMWLLETVPENMQVMKNMPVGTTETATTTINGSSVSVVLPLDGWGNPILFVPPGGLTGLTRGGEFSAQNGSTAATYTNQTVVAPNGRPYWISPGPDTRLDTMDDDVFSFRER